MNLKRLSENASPIIKMFKHVFNTPQGINLQRILLYAAGLTGYACHQAVKASGGRFEYVCEINSKFYFLGGDLNHYTLEGEYSVLNFCSGFFKNFAKDEQRPDINQIVENSVKLLGNSDYRIWGVYNPEDVYNMVKDCWDGIFESMTRPYCEDPSEWPVLYAIVLQNIMVMGLEALPADKLYKMALECVLYISKMNDGFI